MLEADSSFVPELASSLMRDHGKLRLGAPPFRLFLANRCGCFLLHAVLYFPLHADLLMPSDKPDDIGAMLKKLRETVAEVKKRHAAVD